MSFKENLENELVGMGLQPHPHITESLAQYDQLLVHWNRRVNLTSLHRVEDRIRFLYAESLWGAIISQPQVSLLDIGSGCGFPGLAFKILYPELPVILIESRTRKVHFLKEVVKRLDLSGVSVQEARAEELVELPGVHMKNVSWRALKLGKALLDVIARQILPGGTLIFFGTPSSPDLQLLKKLGDYSQRLSEVIPGFREKSVYQFVKRST